MSLAAAILLAPLALLLQQAGWSLLSGAPEMNQMSYDVRRGRLVQCSYGQSDLRTQVWERGDRWHLVAPGAAVPPARFNAASEYDAGRGSLLVFGGYDPSGGGTFGDFWAWNGSQWAQLPSGPGPRMSHRMVYNPVTDRVVLYGGWSGTSYLSDTWEWDGLAWRFRGQGPTQGAQTAMAFDPVRLGVLLFGGSGPPNQVANGTWLWDGTSWTQVATTGPEPRAGAVCATDWSRGRVLLHGGSGTRISPQPFYSDTWAWDGTAWTRLDVGAALPKRSDAGMTYDWRRGTVVMGGGMDLANNSMLNDLWAWTASGWQLVDEAPALRSFTALVSDEGAGGVLLFGGGPVGSPRFNDTWTLHGATWHRGMSTVTPPGRYAHGLAHDALRGETVLFGGRTQTSAGPFVDLDDTWVLRQGQWRQAQPLHRPSPRSDLCMAFDRRSGHVVLYGGGVWPNLNSETWRWDGTDWTLASVAGSGLILPGMAYDERRQRIVVNGRTYPDGVVVTREWTGTNWQFRAFAPDVDGTLVYDDRVGACVLMGQNHRTGAGELWRWDGMAWSSVQGTSLPFSRLAAAYDWRYQRTVVTAGMQVGPLGTNYLSETWVLQWQTVVPRSGEPRLGGTCIWDLALPTSAGLPYLLGLSGGTAGIPVMTNRLGMPILWPISADRLFQITFGLPSLLGVLDSTGRGTARLGLPNDPALDGLQVWASGITLSASLQPAEVTPAVEVMVTR